MADQVDWTGHKPLVVGAPMRLPAPTVELDGHVIPEAPSLLCDSDGVVVRGNVGAAELVGHSCPEQLAGLPLGKLLAGCAPDFRLRRVDGRELAVRVARYPVPGTTLQAVHLVDVSELAAAVDTLHDERRRLDDVSRVAGVGTWEYDPATGETQWSRSHYELLGLGVGSAVPGPETLIEHVHPEDREWATAYWYEHRLSGAPIDVAFRVVRTDGAVRWVNEVGRAHRIDGRIHRITGYLKDITENRLTSTELAEEGARLVEAQRIAHIGSWSYELRTRTVYRSAVLLEMYREIGIEPGDDLLAGVCTADRPLLRDLWRRLLAARTPEPIEVEVRAEPGDRSFVCRARAELDASGRVVRLLGTLQDVTERRALEQQLREDRRRLDDAQRAASLGIWEWDPATGKTMLSDMLYELYGMSLDERTTYDSYLELVHPDDRDWVHALWQQLAVDHEPVGCEHRLVRRDGAVRIFRCHGAAVHGPRGVMLVGTAQDITEQRVAETRVERSSQRFTDLVSVTPVGIGLFDESQRLVDANEALCDLLGVDLDQLRGLTAEQLVQPENRAGRIGAQPTLLAEGTHSYKIPQQVLIRADGDPVYCDLHVATSVQDDGRQFWLIVFQDVTERRRVAEALHHQATHDELTGLPNRAAVKELLCELLDGAEPGRVAVLFCDIDNFKRVNDSLGHDAGDELLVALARRLESGLPPGCTAARLSGDEYLIICRDIDTVGGVEALATRVAGLLRTAVPVHGQLVRVSASIGAAVPNGSPATGPDLLRFADAAMFEAKRRGAGRVSLASAALIASADRQVHLEGQLREALVRDGLTLHFQPVVGADGAVLTAEALVRWPHPDRGLLTPDAFLPVAEQGDLLRELDRWVLRTALREAAGWPVVNGVLAAVAVNLSGLVPGDPDFVDAVAGAVADSGIAWDRVVLELVETSLVDLPSRTLHAMAELVERGVRFAVDDFGTGYSSLARLKDLPAQIIKVDRRFVAGVGTDSSDFAVARAVVDMARAMGRSCVAEGVETAAQFHVLRGVGVDAYQGWLFSRAIPPGEFRGMLALGPLHVPRTTI